MKFIFLICLLGIYLYAVVPTSAEKELLKQHEAIAQKASQLQLTENEKKWLAEHPVIKVGSDPDYAPYEWIDKDGKHVGIVVEYMHILEEILGLHFEFIEDKTWVQLLHMAKNGELDMLTSIVQTPERLEYFTFSEPYRDTPTIIIDNGEGAFIGSLKQLSGKRVSVEKEWFMEEFLKKNYPKISNFSLFTKNLNFTII